MEEPILCKKIIIKGQITCKTGLHIGDSKDKADIGGIDNLIVRNTIDGVPYIPGSSLKGKIRSLLEQVRGINPDGKCKDDGGAVANLFGATTYDGKEGKPSRIIVRDAFMSNESRKELAELNRKGLTDLPYTEIKMENTINRVTGTALNPRKQERIPAGTSFDIEVVLNIVIDTKKKVSSKESSEWVALTDTEREDEEKKTIQDQIALLDEGFNLLKNDYLGGSGSRGYGQIELGGFSYELLSLGSTQGVPEVRGIYLSLS